jgi:hypothetical protein
MWIKAICWCLAIVTWEHHSLRYLMSPVLQVWLDSVSVYGSNWINYSFYLSKILQHFYEQEQMILKGMKRRILLWNLLETIKRWSSYSKKSKRIILYPSSAIIIIKTYAPKSPSFDIVITFKLFLLSKQSILTHRFFVYFNVCRQKNYYFDLCCNT